jgi:hypothetical protein
VQTPGKAMGGDDRHCWQQRDNPIRDEMLRADPKGLQVDVVRAISDSLWRDIALLNCILRVCVLAA